MGSKQHAHVQLLSALSDVLEKSRQNRAETVSTISTLRNQLSALASCRNLNTMDTVPFEIRQQSAEHSESYNEMLLAKYREKCSKMQEELADTKARLSASECRVRDLEVQFQSWFSCSCRSVICIHHIFLHLLHSRVLRTKFINSRCCLNPHIGNCTGNHAQQLIPPLFTLITHRVMMLLSGANSCARAPFFSSLV
jgi:hypothetical protein